MSKRILDEQTVSTVASDDYVYMDGQTNGSSKITPDNLVRNTTVAQQLAQHIADAEDEVEQITSDIGDIQTDLNDLRSDLGDLEDAVPTQGEVDEDNYIVFKNANGDTLFSIDASDLGGGATYGQISLSSNTLTVTEGSSGTITVALASAPSQNQIVYLAVSDSSKISVSPNTLTFTTSNWSTGQTVTVSALADSDSDDETETVVFTSRRVDSKTLTVTITDTTPAKVTSGLQLELDFRNLGSEANTVVDTVGGVTLQSLDPTYFPRVANGVYGSSSYKYASLLTSDTAYTTFKTAMASSASNGFTFEVFGTKMPVCGNLGNAFFLSTNRAQGYDSTPDAISGPSIKPGKMAYVDTNDDPQSNTWNSNNSMWDNGTGNGYITTAQQDFLQADIVFNADGTVDAYYNGFKNQTSFTAPENFASWDMNMALTPTNTYFLGSWQLAGNADHYVTFIRIYNKPLSSSEVTQNINYNKDVIGISNFQ